MEALVARIGKPHGLRGEVTVQLHTDVPGTRFAIGARLLTRPPGVGPLLVRSARVHNGTWLLSFDGAPDRTAAEALRGTELLVSESDAGPVGGDTDGVPGETAADEGWYEDELVGVPVRDVKGAVVGQVVALHLRPAQDLLEVALHDGRRGYVPFVEALVPVVHMSGDVTDRHVVIDPPAGLFDLPGQG
ncbi:MAG: ribosome maturation factor RimM [Micrococcales bacterium]|nr:ribosome maturation factor RimM [Micrococcales bacterium]